MQIQSLSKSHEKNADLKGINKEIESCRRTLDSVRIRMSKYAASLSGKGSRNALRDTFWKLKWQNDSDRLIEARRLVNGHYIRLQLQLSTLGMCVSTSACLQHLLINLVTWQVSMLKAWLLVSIKQNQCFFKSRTLFKQTDKQVTQTQDWMAEAWEGKLQLWESACESNMAATGSLLVDILRIQ